MSNVCEEETIQRPPVVYIGDISLLPNSKIHSRMKSNHSRNAWNFHKKDNELSSVATLRLTLTVDDLGHEIGYRAVQPVYRDFSTEGNFPTSTTKIEIHQTFEFYTIFFKKIHDTKSLFRHFTF